jgi:aspartyl-tRNA(Asn)/glutamyl-tRNA(Gln) amidotransferase subunit A
MESVFVYRNPEPGPPGNGTLAGLRVAVQPNISVTGWPAEAGSRALERYRAVEDATLIRRLRAAGVHLCGSTRMSEFGFGLEGSRAGESVARTDADAELVLDLMGECRAAGLREGVCAYKPSYGLISRLGIIGLIPSMECCGIVSGSVDVIRGLLAVMAGPDGLDFSLPEEPPPDFSPGACRPAAVIGVLAEARDSLPETERRAFDAALGELESAGFLLRELSLPDYALFPLVHGIVGSVEASSSAGRYDSVRYGVRAPGAGNWNDMYLESRREAFGLVVKSYLLQGAFFQFKRYGAYEDACRIRARLLLGMDRLLGEADLLVLPAPGAAPRAGRLGEVLASFDLSMFANVTGQPVLCLPAGERGGAGFQLAGARRGDARVLEAGERLLNLRGRE